MGACFFDITDLSVFCNTSLDQTQVELEYSCSYDSGPFESCNFTIACVQLNHIIRNRVRIFIVLLAITVLLKNH